MSSEKRHYEYNLKLFKQYFLFPNSLNTNIHLEKSEFIVNFLASFVSYLRSGCGVL